MISAEMVINNIDRQLWLTIDCGSEKTGLLALQAGQWELIEIQPSFFLSSYLLCSILRIYTSLLQGPVKYAVLFQHTYIYPAYFKSVKIPMTNRPMMPKGEK